MKWRGSYTVEAAVIIPVLIWTMAAAMCTGIDLLNEVRGEHEEKQMEYCFRSLIGSFAMPPVLQCYFFICR